MWSETDIEVNRADQIMRRLLTATESSRTTLRLLDSWSRLQLVAEACASGVQSMDEGPSIDPRRYGTYRHLEERLEPLIQGDCRTGDPRPPDTLISHYQVYAQMLAPVVVDGVFAGTVSVHQQGQSRLWSKVDGDTLASARHEVEAALEGGELQLDIDFPVPLPSPQVDETTVRRLTACAGLPVPEEDLPHLQNALGEYFQMSAALRAYDLVDSSVSINWDPRW